MGSQRDVEVMEEMGGPLLQRKANNTSAPVDEVTKEPQLQPRHTCNGSMDAKPLTMAQVDDLAHMMASDAGVSVSTVKIGSKTYFGCACGADIIEWLISQGHSATQEDATSLASTFLKLGYFDGLCGSSSDSGSGSSSGRFHADFLTNEDAWYQWNLAMLSLSDESDSNNSNSNTYSIDDSDSDSDSEEDDGKESEYLEVLPKTRVSTCPDPTSNDKVGENSYSTMPNEQALLEEEVQQQEKLLQERQRQIELLQQQLVQRKLSQQQQQQHETQSPTRNQGWSEAPAFQRDHASPTNELAVHAQRVRRNTPFSANTRANIGSMPSALSEEDGTRGCNVSSTENWSIASGRMVHAQSTRFEGIVGILKTTTATSRSGCGPISSHRERAVRSNPKRIQWDLDANGVDETYHPAEYVRSFWFDMDQAMEDWEEEEDDERRRQLEDRWQTFEQELPPNCKCNERLHYEQETARLAQLTRNAQERARAEHIDVTYELLTYLQAADRLYNDILAGAIDVGGHPADSVLAEECRSSSAQRDPDDSNSTTAPSQTSHQSKHSNTTGINTLPNTLPKSNKPSAPPALWKEGLTEANTSGPIANGDNRVTRSLLQSNKAESDAPQIEKPLEVQPQRADAYKSKKDVSHMLALDLDQCLLSGSDSVSIGSHQSSLHSGTNSDATSMSSTSAHHPLMQAYDMEACKEHLTTPVLMKKKVQLLAEDESAAPLKAPVSPLSTASATAPSKTPLKPSLPENPSELHLPHATPPLAALLPAEETPLCAQDSADNAPTTPLQTEPTAPADTSLPPQKKKKSKAGKLIRSSLRRLSGRKKKASKKSSSMGVPVSLETSQSMASTDDNTSVAMSVNSSQLSDLASDSLSLSRGRTVTPSPPPSPEAGKCSRPSSPLAPRVTPRSAVTCGGDTVRNSHEASQPEGPLSLRPHGSQGPTTNPLVEATKDEERALEEHPGSALTKEMTQHPETQEVRQEEMVKGNVNEERAQTSLIPGAESSSRNFSPKSGRSRLGDLIRIFERSGSPSSKSRPTKATPNLTADLQQGQERHKGTAKKTVPVLRRLFSSKRGKPTKDASSTTSVDDDVRACDSILGAHMQASTREPATAATATKTTSTITTTSTTSAITTTTTTTTSAAVTGDERSRPLGEKAPETALSVAMKGVTSCQSSQMGTRSSSPTDDGAKEDNDRDESQAVSVLLRSVSDYDGSIASPVAQHSQTSHSRQERTPSQPPRGSSNQVLPPLASDTRLSIGSYGSENSDRRSQVQAVRALFEVKSQVMASPASPPFTPAKRSSLATSASREPQQLAQSTTPSQVGAFHSTSLPQPPPRTVFGRYSAANENLLTMSARTGATPPQQAEPRPSIGREQFLARRASYEQLRSGAIASDETMGTVNFIEATSNKSRVDGSPELSRRDEPGDTNVASRCAGNLPNLKESISTSASQPQTNPSTSQQWRSRGNVMRMSRSGQQIGKNETKEASQKTSCKQGYKAVVYLELSSLQTAPNFVLKKMGVDLLHKEAHLRDGDFTHALGCTRDEFNQLPLWRQHQKKKRVSLF